MTKRELITAINKSSKKQAIIKIVKILQDLKKDRTDLEMQEVIKKIDCDLSMQLFLLANYSDLLSVKIQ